MVSGDPGSADKVSSLCSQGTLPFDSVQGDTVKPPTGKPVFRPFDSAQGEVVRFHEIVADSSNANKGYRCQD